MAAGEHGSLCKTSFNAPAKMGVIKSYASEELVQAARIEAVHLMVQKHALAAASAWENRPPGTPNDLPSSFSQTSPERRKTMEVGGVDQFKSLVVPPQFGRNGEAQLATSTCVFGGARASYQKTAAGVFTGNTVPVGFHTLEEQEVASWAAGQRAGTQRLSNTGTLGIKSGMGSSMRPASAAITSRPSAGTIKAGARPASAVVQRKAEPVLTILKKSVAPTPFVPVRPTNAEGVPANALATGVHNLEHAVMEMSGTLLRHQQAQIITGEGNRDDALVVDRGGKQAQISSSGSAAKLAGAFVMRPPSYQGSRIVMKADVIPFVRVEEEDLLAEYCPEGYPGRPSLQGVSGVNSMKSTSARLSSGSGSIKVTADSVSPLEGDANKASNGKRPTDGKPSRNASLSGKRASDGQASEMKPSVRGKQEGGQPPATLAEGTGNGGRIEGASRDKEGEGAGAQRMESSCSTSSRTNRLSLTNGRQQSARVSAADAMNGGEAASGGISAEQAGSRPSGGISAEQAGSRPSPASASGDPASTANQSENDADCPEPPSTASPFQRASSATEPPTIAEILRTIPDTQLVEAGATLRTLPAQDSLGLSNTELDHHMLSTSLSTAALEARRRTRSASRRRPSSAHVFSSSDSLIGTGFSIPAATSKMRTASASRQRPSKTGSAAGSESSEAVRKFQPVDVEDRITYQATANGGGLMSTLKTTSRARSGQLFKQTHAQSDRFCNTTNVAVVPKPEIVHPPTEREELRARVVAYTINSAIKAAASKADASAGTAVSWDMAETKALPPRRPMSAILRSAELRPQSAHSVIPPSSIPPDRSRPHLTHMLSGTGVYSRRLRPPSAGLWAGLPMQVNEERQWTFYEDA